MPEADGYEATRIIRALPEERFQLKAHAMKEELPAAPAQATAA